MAIAIEAVTVVVKNEAIEHRYPGGAETFRSNIPNRTFCADESLSRCSFMVEADAEAFLKELGSLGLRVEDGSDAVICDAFHQAMRPACDWLLMGAYQKSVIAWLAGEDVKTIVGPPGWDPENPKPLKFSTTAEAAKRLKYLRSDGNVHAYWDKEDNVEVYIGRTQAPLDLLFQQAGEIVVANLRNPGAPPVREEAKKADLHRAVEMLEIVAEGAPDAWRVRWMLGKAWHALDRLDLAYEPLSKAFELAPDEPENSKELAGICLELGRGEEAVRVAEHAVGLNPRDPELVGNLALAYLVAGRPKEAESTIRAALAMNAGDQINQNVLRIIRQVASGERAQPRNLADLAKKQMSDGGRQSGTGFAARIRKWWKGSADGANS